MYIVHAGELLFETDEFAKNCKWTGEGLPTCSYPGIDFWRVHLDDGMQKELTVYSHKQDGVVTGKNDDITVTYHSLLAEDGRRYDITLRITMKTVGSAMEYTAAVENRDDIRVNEIQCPFVDLSVIAEENRTGDTLYRPWGLGERVENVWDAVAAQHTEYMAADYEKVWMTMTYPFPLSMAWLGVQSGEHFFYLGRHDEKFRTCSLSLGCAPRHEDPRLIFSVSHYPVAVKGETIQCGRGVISLQKGTWEKGADIYTDWAKSWYAPPRPVEWVKNFTGWQRIIMKHQYGEIFFKYPDLVRLYREGLEFGLDTLLVFGWWRGRFDNGYPNYEPDEALGGGEELKKAIALIQKDGGHVILYNNGVLIDVTTDYYTTEGYKLTKKNIDGAEYREFYQFSNNGMMLRTFGYKSFSSACHGTEGWKQKLIENAKLKQQFDPDSLFFDQLGGHHPRFCFDTTHKHGSRCDEDAVYKIECVDTVRELLRDNQCIGTENAADVLSPHFDYSHGCERAYYSDTAYPLLYLRSFPETILTNRFIHDEKEGYEAHLNFAFVNGLRFDVCIFRGRKTGIAGLPGYAFVVKTLLDLKKQYHKYFYGGIFRGEDRSVIRPSHVWANLFSAKDGGSLLVLWNETKEPITLSAHGGEYPLLPNEIKCLEL